MTDLYEEKEFDMFTRTLFDKKPEFTLLNKIFPVYKEESNLNRLFHRKNSVKL